MKKLLSMILFATATGVAFAETPPVKVIATINGENITVEEFDRLWDRLSPQQKSNYDRNGGKLPFLDTLIRRRLLIQEALKENFEKRSDVQADIRAARDGVIFDRYIREVVSEEAVPEKDVLAYYEANKSEFQRGETIKARHILFTPQEGNVVNTTRSDAKSEEEARIKAESFSRLLRGGKGNFSDLALQYSEDGSSTSGGDLGWFPRGKMVKEFDEAAFKLEKGEISEVIKSEFGYHLILVEDKKPGGALPYAQVREEIRDKFLAERIDQIMEAVGRLTQELRGASKINVFRENL